MWIQIAGQEKKLTEELLHCPDQNIPDSQSKATGLCQPY